MLKSYSFNPLWTMNTTIFQETSNLYHVLELITGRLFQKIILGRSVRSSFIDPFSFAKKRCNTSQGSLRKQPTFREVAATWALASSAVFSGYLQGRFAAFFFSHVSDYFSFFSLSRFFSRSFFLVLTVMVTSVWVLNQLRIRIAHNFKFQRQRNELRHPAKSCRKNTISVSS